MPNNTSQRDLNKFGNSHLAKLLHATQCNYFNTFTIFICRSIPNSLDVLVSTISIQIYTKTVTVCQCMVTDKYELI